jgi:hypothetical protein
MALAEYKDGLFAPPPRKSIVMELDHDNVRWFLGRVGEMQTIVRPGASACLHASVFFVRCMPCFPLPCIYIISKLLEYTKVFEEKY